MKIYLSTISIEGTTLKGENPLPIFRDRKKDVPIESDGTLLKEHIEKIGYEIGKRILPYKMQDRYDRKRELINLKTVVIENEKLRAVFLPEYGGRLYSLLDIETGRELLFKNQVFQPANLATRNAWFSGGIEWNISQFGHSLQTCEPLYFAKIKGDDDKYFLRMYEFERMKRIYYQIDFHLPENSKVLYAYVKIINDDVYFKPMYWWTNIAVKENNNLRVFSSTDEVVYICEDSIGADKDSIKKFGYSKLPKLPSVDEATYPSNFPYSNEYFFQTPKSVVSPFEAAVYNDGFIFFERSTNVLRFRKMFCWGSLKGGKKWESFLAREGEGEYVEIQAGLAPTQVNGFDMDGNSVIEFLQAFSFDTIDCVKEREKLNAVYDKDYKKARSIVEDIVNKNIDENCINKLFKKYSLQAENTVIEILSAGSGWGALEDLRRKKENELPSPKSMIFPVCSIDEKLLPWLKLLNEGYLDEIEENEIELSFMVDKNFKNLLEKSVSEKKINASTLIHLGIIYYEEFREDEALNLWLKSIEIKPTALALRNISLYYKNKADINKSLEYMKKAIDILGLEVDKSFMEEYFYILKEVSKFDEIIKIYEDTNYKNIKSDVINEYAAYAYIQKEDYKKLEEILKTELVTIREGENILLDIYYEYKAKIKAKSENIEFSKELIEKVKKEIKAPDNLDFRMVIK